MQKSLFDIMFAETKFQLVPDVVIRAINRSSADTQIRKPLCYSSSVQFLTREVIKVTLQAAFWYGAMVLSKAEDWQPIFEQFTLPIREYREAHR